MEPEMERWMNPAVEFSVYFSSSPSFLEIDEENLLPSPDKRRSRSFPLLCADKPVSFGSCHNCISMPENSA
ncbi:hypothetical protein PoB_001851900 [Plakobranchus ocellatus]|uniref:Uncharacterized protein n=1 Tax=Plakobranchus ocellatus TaxID=259542 RepID=A0AAV3ZCB3_9GAST|nr:hypothetical protein PoB_001851900 [Plakobranchus ocellatus]